MFSCLLNSGSSTAFFRLISSGATLQMLMWTAAARLTLESSWSSCASPRIFRKTNFWYLWNLYNRLREKSVDFRSACVFSVLFKFVMYPPFNSLRFWIKLPRKDVLNFVWCSFECLASISFTRTNTSFHHSNPQLTLSYESYDYVETVFCCFSSSKNSESWRNSRNQSVEEEIADRWMPSKMSFQMFFTEDMFIFLTKGFLRFLFRFRKKLAVWSLEICFVLKEGIRTPLCSRSKRSGMSSRKVKSPEERSQHFAWYKLVRAVLVPVYWYTGEKGNICNLYEFLIKIANVISFELWAMNAKFCTPSPGSFTSNKYEPWSNLTVNDS